MDRPLSAPEACRFSVEDFHRMDAADIFHPDERVELLQGEIVMIPSTDSCQPAAQTLLTDGKTILTEDHVTLTKDKTMLPKG